ncbi:hypothetical protein SERLADRAFT_365546 [Serpula lacrymans var. lacrymans S7.9]|uniref:Uncharacterized protein n=1 Tax=Serpula lacrymans var. lacrymans (strain S7.9) TaxID=578457 RepID=F8NJ62_SERL9|nr:uncharacterized protein SERLADRAFT_365546 [Serpula lacrymans var. lacrymans S7.9]EGO29546.1 hypothetical protein SERLADRAFT_365546 [Serpula lacrymans var. lacrymans S7.9]
MRNEAIVAGLHLHSTDITWKLEDLQKQTIESLTWGWWPLEAPSWTGSKYCSRAEGACISPV